MSMSEASMQTEFCKNQSVWNHKLSTYSLCRAHKSNMHCCDDYLFKSKPQTFSIKQWIKRGRWEIQRVRLIGMQAE